MRLGNTFNEQLVVGDTDTNLSIVLIPVLFSSVSDIVILCHTLRAMNVTRHSSPCIYAV